MNTWPLRVSVKNLPFLVTFLYLRINSKEAKRKKMFYVTASSSSLIIITVILLDAVDNKRK